jgi:hypothetical protein
MKQCAQCRGPFGLTRRHTYRLWGGSLHFCSLRCKETHEADRLRRLAEARFLCHTFDVGPRGIQVQNNGPLQAL